MYTSSYYKQNLEGDIIRLGTPVAAYSYGVRKASASDPARFPCLGLVTFVRSDRLNMHVSQSGFVRRDDWTAIIGAAALTSGAKYYLSATAGMLTTVAAQSGVIENRHIGTAANDETMQIALLGEDVTVPEIVPEGAFATGTVSLASGVFEGSVSGLALDEAPSRVIVTVRRPANGLAIFACVDDGTLTVDGFTFQLSGITDSANYKLDYILVP